MDAIATITELSRHGRVANDLVFAASAQLSDEQLDRPLDLGLGSLRRICQHLVAGEVTWLARIQGNVEAKWPAEPIPSAISQMQPLLAANDSRLQTFLTSLSDDRLEQLQRYRDSKGSLFQATLHQMLLQMNLHSTHHRAQIVNAIRRVGGHPPEVDYMMQVRKPV